MTDSDSTDTESEQPIDPRTVVDRDDWTCQRCGYQFPEGEADMMALQIGPDETNPADYETRCQKCRDKAGGWSYKLARPCIYVFLIPAAAFAGIIPVSLMGAGAKIMLPHTGTHLPLIEYLLAMFVVGPLMIVGGIIAFVIWVQLVIWHEPAHGIVWRVATPVWERTGSKVVAKLRQRAATLHQRVSLG